MLVLRRFEDSARRLGYRPTLTWCSAACCRSTARSQDGQEALAPNENSVYLAGFVRGTSSFLGFTSLPSVRKPAFGGVLGFSAGPG